MTSASAKSLIRLGLIIVAVSAGFILTGLTALYIVIVSVILIVLLHELGHFATAKWSGMKVTEYFVGFGPRLWSFKRGETEYGVKAIPAGGYVKIPGMSNMEEIDPGDESRTYRRQPFSKRILVASAGSIVHYVIAFVLAFAMVLSFGAPAAHYKIKVESLIHLTGVAQTPAQKAGIHPGDVIEAVNTTPLSTSSMMTPISTDTKGKTLVFTIQRGTSTLHVPVTPVAGYRTGPNTTKTKLGTAPTTTTQTAFIGIGKELATTTASKNPLTAIPSSLEVVRSTTWSTIRYVPAGVAAVFSGIFTTRSAKKSAKTGKRAESIVGAVRTATQLYQVGIRYFLSVMIALNIVFALLNMLPMLPLDGGHVAIAIYERIRTRRGKAYYQADAKKLLPVAYGFMLVLLVIVMSALYLDLVHPVNIR